MTLKIRFLPTGEFTIPSSGIGGIIASADVKRWKREDLPYGFKEAIRFPDGTVSAGVRQPAPIWYIEGAKERILVDTSFDPSPERTLEVIGRSYGCSRSPDQTVEAALSKVGVKPEEIDLVILTHLHHDHIGHNELFTNATFIAQNDELPLALAPPRSGFLFYYKEFAHHVLNVIDRMELIDGDKKITEGVEVWKMGGHSPGLMSVIVETDAGRIAIASDLVYDYKNLELDLPIGTYWNMKEVTNAYQRLRLATDIVLPNHDWRILKEYPNGEIP